MVNNPTKRTPAPRRKPGRPRTAAPGSKPVFTTLSPDITAELEELAATDRRSVSATAAILIEEALRARKASK